MESLKTAGMVAFDSQAAANFKALDRLDRSSPIVVISSAIPDHNPELIAARERQLEVWHRSDLTCSTDRPATIDRHRWQPRQNHHQHRGDHASSWCRRRSHSCIGGIVPCYDSNGHAGQGRLLVAEADESDGSLVKFRASLGVITNLELDHTDHYRDLDDLIDNPSTLRKWLQTPAGQSGRSHPQRALPGRCLVVDPAQRQRGFCRLASGSGRRSHNRRSL